MDRLYIVIYVICYILGSVVTALGSTLSLHDIISNASMAKKNIGENILQIKRKLIKVFTTVEIKPVSGLSGNA